VGQAALMKEAEHLANFGSWKADLATGRHQWSDEAFRIFGFAPGEIEPDQDTFFKHVHPDDKDSLKKIIGEVINGLDFQQCEYRIIDRDKNVKNLLSKILVKRNADNHPHQLV